ncbi:hypothetical protein [Vibrio rhodolitus]|uniref:hypothetical protein n=1 Tax=Vibrio rhodolitus TaxID=2231649 RepID=UPI000E0A3ABB|nr:hypothetical protein [Vibrio rhodolitus]
MVWMEIYRVTVFVPKEHIEKLKQAVCSVEPLKIGNYEQVIWSTYHVEEQFTPTSGAKTTVGNINESMIVDAVRMEFCIPRDRALLENIIENAIFVAHPWEVPGIVVDESLIPFKNV